jgi:hypothetical protein
MRKFFRVTFLAALCGLELCSCGLTDWIGPTTEATTTTSATTTARRQVDTTKTAVYDGNSVDSDDEDFDGYGTTTSLTGGTLENEYSQTELYDENVRATTTTTTTVKTYYTLPEHNGTTAASGVTSKTTSKTTTKTTTAATTTELNANALYHPTDSMKYSSSKEFTVTSDTTYLNLRFGPSKEYDVQLKIPNGSTVYGNSETTDTDGNAWIFVTYNGTSGWVMKSLLS